MITNNMTWGQIKKELLSYGVKLEYGWQLMLSHFLEKCDYIEIVGYGDFAQLKLIKDGIEIEV